MAASGWEYFAPYQEDINAALQKLRQQVFESGAFYKRSHDEWRGMSYDEAVEHFSSHETGIRSYLLSVWREIKDLQEPNTLENLLLWNRESGTHSIIDINRGVSEEPEIGTVSPPTQKQLFDLFGTTQPTHDMVAGKISSHELYTLRNRWEGIYVIVYDDDIPVELCFVGFSGD